MIIKYSMRMNPEAQEAGYDDNVETIVDSIKEIKTKIDGEGNKIVVAFFKDASIPNIKLDIDIFEDNVYVMNDNGKTIEVITPAKIKKTESVKTKIQKINIGKFCSLFSVSEDYHGNDILCAISNMQVGKSVMPLIPINKNTAPAWLLDGNRIERDDWRRSVEIHGNKIYKLFAGHSNYHGSTICEAMTRLALGQEISCVSPIEEDVLNCDKA